MGAKRWKASPGLVKSFQNDFSGNVFLERNHCMFCLVRFVYCYSPTRYGLPSEFVPCPHFQGQTFLPTSTGIETAGNWKTGTGGLRWQPLGKMGAKGVQKHHDECWWTEEPTVRATTTTEPRLSRYTSRLCSIQIRQLL